MGKHGKGEANENGIYLLNFCLQHDLYLTNTNFKHKMVHRTTWQAPERNNATHRDGTARKNPYRNMTDYIITRKSHLCFIKDSRSYAGLYPSSDHRLVKAVVNINKPAHPRKSNTKIYDNFEISKLRNNAGQYSNLVASEIEIDSADTPQQA